MKLIRTQNILVVKNDRIDLKKYPGCMDMAFRNDGSTDCFLQPEGGVQERIQPGDPLLTWGGYEGYYRNDSLSVTFTGGTGRLYIDLTIHVNYKDCI